MAARSAYDEGIGETRHSGGLIGQDASPMSRQSIRGDLRKTYASAIVMALTAFIIYAMLPYINAFFGAIILYTLFHPLYHRLKDNLRLDNSVAALTVIVFSIFLITIPFLYAMGLLLDEAKTIISNMDVLSNALDEADKLLPGINLREIVIGEVAGMITVVRDQILLMIYGFAHTVVNLTIMYFLLYYMLRNHEDMPKVAMSISPFNEKNTRRLAQEVYSITYCTIISQGAVGVLHGALLAVGFHFFGIPNAVFWGFVGVILSILPFFGTPLIWVPAGMIRIFQGDLVSGFGIIVWGALLTNVDSILRPAIQLKVSKIHPLISVIGFFIGVSYFGILGIIVGPLLLSYFFLMFGMFKEEYLTNEHNPAV